ncbi:MAG: histidine kinase [Parvularculaceae bacterium]
MAIVAPVAGESFAWIAYFAFQIATNKPISLVVNWSSALLILAMYTWLFFAWASLILSIEYSFDLREEERQNSHFRSLAQEAKLSALQAQINPHFLFNSLNSLSALILDRKIEAAEEMVSRLAQFFRLNLTTNALEDTPLENEIKMQREYLAIEQVRYPNLKVMIDVDDSIREVMVPPLILQPLVENAVKYGAVKAGSSPDILISATPLKDGQLRILVENECADNCQSHRAPGTGLGLRYVRERLQSRFGDKFDMGILRSPNNKFSVSIRIPSSI